MAFYVWWQAKSDSPWSLCLEAHKDAILRDKKPELMTVLSADNSFETELGPDELNRVKYRGPVYFDFDSANIQESTDGAREFIKKLKSHNVDIESCKIFASGGKGYHIEIPPETFMVKVPLNGIFLYPRIQREIANELFVETLDLRVYSAKRGRQWRCPNVLRQNGRYKVQITPQELANMTPEQYVTITSQPRPLFPVATATFNPDLGLLFARSSDKVSASMKTRAKARREAIDTLSTYQGQWPDEAVLVLNGVALRPGVGFNQVAMQISILAVALGKSEEELLSDAENLIERHSGDSARYGTPAKRKTALRDTYRYVFDNAAYKWDLPMFLSILDQQTRQTGELGRGDYPAPAPAPVPAAAPDTVESEDDSDPIEQPRITREAVPEPLFKGEDRVGALRVDRFGMYLRGEHGWKKMSDVGIDNPIRLIDNGGKEGGSTMIGYEVDVYVGGKFIAQDIVSLDRFQSKSALQQWTLKYSCSLIGTDTQASSISDVLRSQTMGSASQVWVIRTEGVDFVMAPNATAESDSEIVWSSHSGVISPKGNNYRFKPVLDVRGVFKSDLFNAPEIETENDKHFKYAMNLTEINSPINTAKLLGWFSAAFLCPIFRKIYGQFPSLQVFGQAGAGKSKSVAFLNHMHYYLAAPKELQATGQTMFPVIAAVASSSSIPVVFEEVKPREMTKTTHDFLLNIFRSNYNGHSISRGALTQVGGGKELTVNDYMNRCPLAFVGEAIETQTAILERCVLVNLSKADRLNRGPVFSDLYRGRKALGIFGKSIAQSAMAMDIEQFGDTFDQIHERVATAAGDLAEGADRPIYNMAVAIMGLHFMSRVLASSFDSERGDAIIKKYDKLADALFASMSAELPKAVQEVSRVIDTMAVISKMQGRQFTLTLGTDYTVDLVRGHIDLKLKPCFAKYVEYMRTVSQIPLFDNETSFITAMMKYGGLVTRDCQDNLVLFRSRLEPLFRLKVSYLENEGVEPFNSGDGI